MKKKPHLPFFNRRNLSRSGGLSKLFTVFYVATIIGVLTAFADLVYSEYNALGPRNSVNTQIKDTDVTAIVEALEKSSVTQIRSVPEVAVADKIDSQLLLPTNITQTTGNGSISTVLQKEENIESEAEDIKVDVWRRNAIASLPSSVPKIAIIIDDLGLDRDALVHFSDIDVPLTLSFLPYADSLPEQTGYARAHGHEIMVHMPMEPKNRQADPGNNALLTTIDYKEFDRRLRWNLDRFDGYVGVNNHMGSALTEDAGRMVRIMAKLKKSGIFYVDSLTSSETVGPSAAKAAGVPYLKRDIFLDNDRVPHLIARQLDKTLRIAEITGAAIAIGHPYPETISALKNWIASHQNAKIDFVPISRLVIDKLDHTDIRAGR